VSLRRFVTALAWCMIPSLLHAQLPPLGIPKGMLRVEVQAQFGSASMRFDDGTRENLGADFSSAALGPTELPVLDEPSRRLGVLVGSTGYQLNLGSSAGFANQTRSLGALGLGIGLSSRITLFARAPIVYATSQRTATIASGTGDAGINPADPSLGSTAGRSATAGFFSEFDTGLLALESNIAGGVYDGDPTQRALAEQTLAGGIAFRDSLRAVMLDEGTVSPFLPIGTSSAGGTLSGRVTALQATLSGSLGVASFATPLPLPAAADATYEAIEGLALDPAGAYAYTSYSRQKRTGLGDVELGGAFTFIDTWDRDAQGGFRLAVEGLVRLPTGTKDDPDVAFPAPGYDGQMDVQVQAAADLGGGNLGLRLTGGYLLQLSSSSVRRVAAPGTLLVPFTNRAEVSFDPGDELFIGVTPFLRLARPLALLLGVQYRHRSEDGASFTGAAIPGVDPAVLGEGTGYSAVLFSAGINYSETGRRAGSQARTPIDAGWFWDTVISGSGGRVTKASTIRMLVRIYAQLW
jgi:hypothetical protein